MREPARAASTLQRLKGIPSRHVRVPAHVLERGRAHVDVHAGHWEAESPAAPPQVCVHGLGGSCLNWISVAPRLAAGGHVWAPDLPGFGHTSPTGRSASLEDNLDLLAGFVATVGAGRPAFLYGHSMGGHLAYRLAARRPDLVAGLVLIGPAVPPVTNHPDPRTAVRFLLVATPLAGTRWLERTARRLTPAEQVRATMELCTADADRVDPEVFEAHVQLNADRRRMAHASPAYVTAARSLMRHLGPRRRKAWEEIDAVSVPTLLLQGALDRLMTLASMERVLARRPDWDHRVYPDLGHLVMLEAPDRVAADILAWRADVGAGAAP